MPRRLLTILLAVVLCPGTRTLAQHPATPSQQSVGIFDNHLDIGHPRLSGSASYNDSTQAYEITGAGSNIWFNRDEFHFLYKKLKGDFMLTADFAFAGDTAGSVGHRKIGWMIRESTDEGAASANACEHIDGLVVLQWRPYKGMFMRDPEEERFYPKKGGQTMRLERIGKTITMWIAHPGQPLEKVGSCEMDALNDEVLAGIYICSHDSASVAYGKIWNVRIDQPIQHPYTSNPHAVIPPVKEELGSRFEVVDIADGYRKIGRETPVRLDAGPDGEEYSPDKKYRYYSVNSNGTRQIWRMRSNGTGKEQLTFDEYHNWHPRISPDGKWMAFISFPPDIDPNTPPLYQKAMLRLLPLTTPGAPRVLAYFYGGQESLNTPTWTPDSRFISFISNITVTNLP